VSLRFPGGGEFPGGKWRPWCLSPYENMHILCRMFKVYILCISSIFITGKVSSHP
jgi:hypothetical protein